MSNSGGTVFARGLRQGDPGPLWDEKAGRNDTEQCASELLDPSAIRSAVFPTARGGRGVGVGSTYALWTFYITPNTAEGIGSHRPPLLTHHRPPFAPTLHFANGNSLTGFRISVENCEFFILLRSIVLLIPRKEGQKPGYRVQLPPTENPPHPSGSMRGFISLWPRVQAVRRPCQFWNRTSKKIHHQAA